MRNNRTAYNQGKPQSAVGLRGRGIRVGRPRRGFLYVEYFVLALATIAAAWVILDYVLSPTGLIAALKQQSEQSEASQ